MEVKGKVRAKRSFGPINHRCSLSLCCRAWQDPTPRRHSETESRQMPVQHDFTNKAKVYPQKASPTSTYCTHGTRTHARTHTHTRVEVSLNT